MRGKTRSVAGDDPRVDGKAEERGEKREEADVRVDKEKERRGNRLRKKRTCRRRTEGGRGTRPMEWN